MPTHVPTHTRSRMNPPGTPTGGDDPFGHLLLDLVDGRAGPEIIERDDGFVSLGSSRYLAPPQAWPAHERQALERCRGRVLDVGAGAGRFALALQERGHEVVAIDVSPGAVEACRRRGVRDARRVALEQISPDLGTFDTVVMMGNNFGLFGPPVRVAAGLERLGAVMADGAELLAQTLDPYRTDDPLHLAYHERNRARGRLAGQIHMRVRYRTDATPWFDLLVVSREEMDTLLEGSGWYLADVLDDDGPTWVAVIRKEPS